MKFCLLHKSFKEMAGCLNNTVYFIALIIDVYQSLLHLCENKLIKMCELCNIHIETFFFITPLFNTTITPNYKVFIYFKII